MLLLNWADSTSIWWVLILWSRFYLFQCRVSSGSETSSECMIPWPILVRGTIVIAINWRGIINASMSTWKYGCKSQKIYMIICWACGMAGSLHCFLVCTLQCSFMPGVSLTICSLSNRQQTTVWCICFPRNVHKISNMACGDYYMIYGSILQWPTTNWLLSFCEQFLLESWDHCCFFTYLSNVSMQRCIFAWYFIRESPCEAVGRRFRLSDFISWTFAKLQA